MQYIIMGNIGLPGRIGDIPYFAGDPDLVRLFTMVVRDIHKDVEKSFECLILPMLYSRLLGPAKEKMEKRIQFHTSVEYFLEDLDIVFGDSDNDMEKFLSYLEEAQQINYPNFVSYAKGVYYSRNQLFDRIQGADEQLKDWEVEEYHSFVNKHALEQFITGLSEPLKISVRSRKPKSLAEAVAIAAVLGNHTKDVVKHTYQIRSIGRIWELVEENDDILDFIRKPKQGPDKIFPISNEKRANETRCRL